jgi:hypothetical protein
MMDLKVGDVIWFNAFNGRRKGRIEKIGPKRVTVSYLTKAQAQRALGLINYAARDDGRYQRQFPLAKVVPHRSGLGWEVTK